MQSVGSSDLSLAPIIPDVNECPTCGGPLVAIALRLTDNELVMRSCSKCDRRFWEADGLDIELAGLLGREPLRQPALR